MHMQPIFRMNGFVTSGAEDVGMDIFQRGCACPATTR